MYSLIYNLHKLTVRFCGRDELNMSLSGDHKKEEGRHNVRLIALTHLRFVYFLSACTETVKYCAAGRLWGPFTQLRYTSPLGSTVRGADMQNCQSSL